MIIRKEHESYILDAHHNCQGPKDKRHDTKDIRFRQGDGMNAVKAYLESVEGTCPDIAKNYTQGAKSQYWGSIFERMMIGLSTMGQKIEVIGKACVQSHHDRRLKKTKLTPKSLSARAGFFPLPIKIVVYNLQR
jgi:hypothetical protein